MKKLFIILIIIFIKSSGCVFKKIVVLDANQYNKDYGNSDVINYEMYFASKKIISKIEEMTYRDKLQLKNQAYKCHCDTIYVDLKTNFGDPKEIENYLGWEESNKTGVFYYGLAFSKRFKKKFDKSQKEKANKD